LIEVGARLSPAGTRIEESKAPRGVEHEKCIVGEVVSPSSIPLPFSSKLFLRGALPDASSPHWGGVWGVPHPEKKFLNLDLKYSICGAF